MLQLDPLKRPSVKKCFQDVLSMGLASSQSVPSIEKMGNRDDDSNGSNYSGLVTPTAWGLEAQ
jgi:hypothetical protein